jgi:hypothetical protein
MLASRQNRRSRSALILVALFTQAAQAAATDTRPDDYVLRARQFLRTLYPGLDGRLRPVIIGNRLRDTTVRQPDVMNVFTMELHDFEIGISGGAPTTCWSSEPALTARFGFDWQTENKELAYITVWGPAINGAVENFAKEVDKHPEWPDAKVAAAMDEAGAKFGPDHKAQFLRAFPREQLKPFVGGDLEVNSAEFYVRGTCKGCSPVWVVQAKWHSLDGRESDCTLAFEPFQGNLQMISLMPVIPKAGGQQGNEPKPKVP